ncbi:uncharacterized protein LOC144444717 [Glandiceps talaboti]
MSKLGLWMSLDSDSDDDDRMDEGEADSNNDHEPVCGLMQQDLQPSTQVFTQHITTAEYQKQRQEYTKQALQELLNSHEYQKIYKTCSSCNASWYYDQANAGCAECGYEGYANKRPCAICHGKCPQIWTRDVDMSRKMKQAHWNGKCGLPEEEQQAYMLENLVDADEDILTDAMQDL